MNLYKWYRKRFTDAEWHDFRALFVIMTILGIVVYALMWIGWIYL